MHISITYIGNLNNPFAFCAFSELFVDYSISILSLSLSFCISEFMERRSCQLIFCIRYFPAKCTKSNDHCACWRCRSRSRWWSLRKALGYAVKWMEIPLGLPDCNYRELTAYYSEWCVWNLIKNSSSSSSGLKSWIYDLFSMRFPPHPPSNSIEMSSFPSHDICTHSIGMPVSCFSFTFHSFIPMHSFIGHNFGTHSRRNGN